MNASERIIKAIDRKKIRGVDITMTDNGALVVLTWNADEADDKGIESALLHELNYDALFSLRYLARDIEDRASRIANRLNDAWKWARRREEKR